MGGLARRAGMIESIRKHHEHVILLDCGDTFNTQKTLAEERAQTIWNAMGRMHYDVINVAEGELSLGWPFFKNLLSQSPMVAVSANFDGMSTPDDASIIRPYLVKQVGSWRVGIIGITQGAYYEQAPHPRESIAFSDERQALSRHLPELRKQADIVVVLSHLGVESTLSLMQSNLLEGADVVIAGHGRGLSATPPQKVHGAILVQTSMGGEYLGQLIVSLDAHKNITGLTSNHIALTDQVPEDESIRVSMQAFAAKEKESRKQGGRAYQRAQTKAMQEKYLKMSPQEFLEAMQKEGRAVSNPPETTPPAQTP